MKSMLAAAAMLVAVSTASGQSSQPTVQQQFDAASSALGDENWAEALRLYEALENRIRRNPRTLAVVRVRKAEALARLRRFAEADEAVRLGLPSLSADDPTLREDRLRAFRTSGTIAELSLDFAEAARRYRAGMDIEGPIDQRLALHRGLIQNLIFSDRDAALPAADEALRIVGATPDNRRLRGQFKTLRGRALLNLGRNAEARTELLQAVSLLGGMTARVDAADIVARSDLALAALFLGDEATARRYLAMTGAGRFRTGALDPHWDNRPPPCGNGLRPEDVAVIEFALALDGSVLHASPVYATTTLAAREMSRAVQSWYFQPEQLASLHVLFRGLSRVELRCSRLESIPTAWLTATGGDGSNAPARARTAADLRAALAAQDEAPVRNGEQTFALLVALVKHPGVDRVETVTHLRRALEMMRDTPPDPLLSAQLLLVSTWMDRPVEPEGNNGDVAAALAQPIARDRPQVAAALHFTRARALYYEGRYPDALAQIEQMKVAAGGAPDPSFRADALALEAAIRAAQGDMDGARVAHVAIGSPPPRCGALPHPLQIPGRSADFPIEAMRWGFEGWASAEAAIRSNGTVAEARRVIAYPPFVFGEAAERIIVRGRYERSYVPDGQACIAHRQRVVFRLPD